jgi:hypothetical protein
LGLRVAAKCHEKMTPFLAARQLMYHFGTKVLLLALPAAARARRPPAVVNYDRKYYLSFINFWDDEDDSVMEIGGISRPAGGKNWAVARSALRARTAANSIGHFPCLWTGDVTVLRAGDGRADHGTG